MYGKCFTTIYIYMHMCRTITNDFFLQNVYIATLKSKMLQKPLIIYKNTCTWVQTYIMGLINILRGHSTTRGAGTLRVNKAWGGGGQAIDHKQCLPPPPPPNLCLCRAFRRHCPLPYIKTLMLQSHYHVTLSRTSHIRNFREMEWDVLYKWKYSRFISKCFFYLKSCVKIFVIFCMHVLEK